MYEYVHRSNLNMYLKISHVPAGAVTVVRMRIFHRANIAISAAKPLLGNAPMFSSVFIALIHDRVGDEFL